MLTGTSFFRVISIVAAALLFISTYASAQNFINPLQNFLKTVEPGMTEDAFRQEVKKLESGFGKKVKVYDYTGAGVISLLWEGDEIIEEGRRPTANLATQFQKGRVWGAWYTASHFDPFTGKTEWDREDKGHLCALER